MYRTQLRCEVNLKLSCKVTMPEVYIRTNPLTQGCTNDYMGMRDNSLMYIKDLIVCFRKTNKYLRYK